MTLLFTNYELSDKLEVQCTEGTQGTLNQIFEFENKDLIYLHEIFWMFAGYLPDLEYVIRYLVVIF